MSNYSEESLQLQGRVAKMRVPNDKLSKVLFERTPEQYQKLIAGGNGKIVETTDKKGNKIKTSYWLNHVDGYTDMTPLREFDRAVMSVCISTIESGMTFTTVDAVFRAMTGGKNIHAKIYPAQKSAILESIRRLMKTVIRIDMRPICKAVKKYGKKMSKPVIESPILPCELSTGKVNGQGATIIKLPREPPLWTVANAKGQILTFDVADFNVPNQNNTFAVIELKSYVLRRVHEIIAHNRNMTPTITFADVFGHCGLSDAADSSKRNARKAVFAIFEHLKSSGVIQSFEKKKTGGAYSTITFSVYDLTP